MAGTGTTEMAAVRAVTADVVSVTAAVTTVTATVAAVMAALLVETSVVSTVVAGTAVAAVPAAGDGHRFRGTLYGARLPVAPGSQ